MATTKIDRQNHPNNQHHKNYYEILTDGQRLISMDNFEVYLNENHQHRHNERADLGLIHWDFNCPQPNYGIWLKANNLELFLYSLAVYEDGLNKKRKR